MRKGQNLKLISAAAGIIFITLAVIAVVRGTSSTVAPLSAATERPGDQLHAEEDYAAQMLANTGIFEGTDVFNQIGSSIRNAVNSGTFKAEDFEKLDFSLPGEGQFGDDPEHEVFNSAGPFKVSLELMELNFYPQLRHGLTDQLRPVFTMYRTVSSTGLIAETIYGVIPGITAEICRRSDQQIELNSAPPMKPVIEGGTVPPFAITGFSYGCVLDKSAAKYYLLALVAGRIKSQGGKWQL